MSLKGYKITDKSDNSRPMTAAHTKKGASRYQSSLSYRKVESDLKKYRVKSALRNNCDTPNWNADVISYVKPTSSLEIFKDRCDTLSRKNEEIEQLRQKMMMTAEEDTQDQTAGDDSQ